MDRTTYVQDVVTALTRTGRHGPAWLYVGLWGDYYQRVPYRSNEAWASVLGASRRQVVRWWQDLAGLGLVRVVQEGVAHRRVELLVRPGLPLLARGEGRETPMSHSVTPMSHSETPMSHSVTWMSHTLSDVDNSVSPCYVTVCENGTEVALTTTTSYTASTAGVVVGKTTTLSVGNTRGASQKPTAGRPRRGRPTSTKKPKGEGKKPKEPKGSHDFRRLPMATIEALEPERFAQITTLHADWNGAMGTKYSMNPWAYAAWRLALVEAGYPEEKLRAAMPVIAADSWWHEKYSDPHKMFAHNPAKIEQFFPENRTTAPDRLGRGVSYRTDSFEF